MWRTDEAGAPTPSRANDWVSERGKASLWSKEDRSPTAAAVAEPEVIEEPGEIVPPVPERMWRTDEIAAAESGEPPRAPRTTDRTVLRKKGARKWVRRSVLAVLTLAVLLFATDLFYSGLILRGELTRVRDSLDQAQDSLQNGDLAAANAAVRQALRSSREAVAASDRPALSLLGLIPYIDRDVRALRALADAGELAARAARVGYDASDSVGVGEAGLAGSVYKNGRIDFETIDTATPEVADLRKLLSEATGVLEAAPAPLLGPVVDAITSARSRLSSASESAAKGKKVLEALPALLGRGSERRYLLAFQALGEARGTGGVAGLYGTLVVKDGKPSLTHVGPFSEFQPDDRLETPVEAPKWFEKSYGPQLALDQWQQANLSPNFPVVSEVMLDMFEQATGRRLDGLIAMDPIAFSYLLEGTGPISAPGLDVEVNSTNAASVLMQDVYLELPNEREQNAYLSTLVDRFWNRIRKGKVDAPAFVEGLGEAVRTQHFKLYSRDEDDQSAVADLGAAGTFEPQPNVQLVFNDNYSANKVDYYLHRHIDTKIQLLGNGDARAETTITMRNEAPDGPKNILLGPVSERGSVGDPPGWNRMILNFLLPAGATTSELQIDGEATIPSRYTDEGHPVAWTLLEIPASATSTATLSYYIPGAAAIDSAGGTFRFLLFPQATVNPDEYSVTMAPPPGMIFAEGTGVNEEGTRYNADGTLDGPTPFSLRIEKP